MGWAFHMALKGQISALGRICLFGEHQDYLGLPVIPIDISKRLKLITTLKAPLLVWNSQTNN